MSPRADLPDWPALMDTPTACAYCSLSEATFRLLALRCKVHPVDLGFAVTRWARTDLDRMIDNLGRRGVTLAREAPATPAADSSIAIEDAQVAALEAVRRRMAGGSR